MNNVQHRAMRGMMWAGLGSLLQQLLSMVVGIFLANILSPADYGSVGVLAVFSAIAGSLQESGFIAALTNRSEVRHEDYNAVFWCSLGVSLLCYTILFFCAPLIAALYDDPELLWLSRYLFLSFVFSSTGIAHSAWLFKHLMVKQRTMAQVPALIISGTVSITMAWMGYGCWALATQTILYVTVCSVWFWSMSGWRPTFTFNMQPVREMFGFSSRLLATNLFIQLQDNVTTAIMGVSFRRNEVGQYAQSAKWSTMGCGLIISIVNNVAQPALREAAREKNSGAVQLELLRAMLRATAWLAFPALTGLMLVARPFIILTIGAQWLPCVPLLQVLCIWAALKPLNYLFGQMTVSCGRSSLFMWMTIAMATVQIATLLLMRRWGIMAMTCGYVASSSVFTLVWMIIARRLLSLRLRYALVDTGRFMLAAVVAMGTTWWLTRGIDNMWLLLGARIALGGSFYLALTHRQLLRWMKKM